MVVVVFFLIIILKSGHVLDVFLTVMARAFSEFSLK